MLATLLSQYVTLPVSELNRLLSLDPESIYDDSAYLDLIGELDAGELNRTAAYARAAYDQGLPAIKEKYHWTNTAMSGYTLCNWVLGFLMYPEWIRDILHRHNAVLPSAARSALPEIIALLDDLPEGRAAWQRALVTLSLPLLADR